MCPGAFHRCPRLGKMILDKGDGVLSAGYYTAGGADYVFWLLFVAALTAVTIEEVECLLRLLRAEVWANGLHSWRDVRQVFNRFMWIDALHSEDGKAVFARVAS